MVEIMEGAHYVSGQNFTHLKTIRKSIYPNNKTMKIICGRN
jgi:hypothetical protein